MVRINEFFVSSFSELHEVFKRYQEDKAWIFRGQGKTGQKLVPKAGREPYVRYDDELIFKLWKRKAFRLVDSVPGNDFDWLALAQSYGLATRLLDWTSNPLTAVFFAAQDPSKTDDCCVYAYHTHEELDTMTMDPFSSTGVKCVNPNGISRRMLDQGGLFTLHSPPGTDLIENLNEDDRLECIRISGKQKSKIIEDLSFYGVNRMTLFPDLQGLSAHLNWCMERAEASASREIRL